jgi:general secretion pathway protein K
MRRDEKGIALIAVILALALLSTIAASFTFETRSEARIGRNMASHTSARAAADAGIQRAILDSIESGGVLDRAKFRPNGTVYAWPFGDSTVYISVRDELGKVNLNQAPEALLSALFVSVGVDDGTAAALADAVADFRDIDDFRRPHGAEEPDYRRAGLSWGPANAPFQTVEQLQQVLGMTNEIYDRVAGYLTIYSTGNTINPDTADANLASTLRDAGFKYFVESPGMAYAIRAEARTRDGAVFVREAVIQPVPNMLTPMILAWR